MKHLIEARYCTCGAVLKAPIERRRKAVALGVWFATHSGPGHAECSAAVAEQARMGFGQPGGREAMKARKEHGA